MTTSTRTFEETFTFPIQRVLNEFQRIEPLEVYLPSRPYDMNQNLTSVIQGRRCLEEYHRAKRFKDRKGMILYLYYLGEVIEGSPIHEERNTNHIESTFLITIGKSRSKLINCFESSDRNKYSELQERLP